MIKLGICNELFEGWEFPEVCRAARGLGYDGLELAPFTFADRITNLKPERRREIRAAMEDHGLTCIGLHWLLAKTEGFHLTTPDRATRAKTGEYLIELARACKELGGSLLVFGSPKQRDVLPGLTYEQAFDHALEVFSSIMPEIGDLGIDFCLEPLAPSETNFLTTIPQAMALIERVDHPRFKLHMDVKAQSADTTGTVPELIARYAPGAGHFHAQDTNLKGPGMGQVDFGPILETLVRTGYDRWVSVEVFDFSEGPIPTASRSFECLRRELDSAYASQARQA